VRASFVDQCAEELSRNACECSYDEIASAVPFEDFAAWERQLADDAGAEPPESLQAAIQSCEVAA